MTYSFSIFNDQQKRRTLVLLSFFHIFIIAASNYLVQIPFEVHVPLTFFGAQENFVFHSTWGTLTFPFIFLATDLTVRVFGAKEARLIIFVVMIPALIISYVVSTLFSDSQYQGWQALTTFNLFVFRIALASFCAYVFGQLLDVLVFNRLRQLKTWWIAPTSSMVFGSMADTYLFFAIAFYASSDPFMAEHWMEIGFVDYLFKLFIGLLLFVPAYGVVLNMILRKIQTLTAAVQTEFDGKIEEANG
ncbi:7-cyano-7-deazaguanine/7-aminomethyl-7-deazaguanine transporter [Aggregatibacter actinomycetemcomitans]|uniref:7-cyano-7-deazaguanine/7-aminomethyl-7- deazaguanine transporter n=1 Tax=Aggregatibacter actinomycetemcomitans TaxID=714 RepID=UPI00197C1480|nr:7-cyano-7-deazaguanine/7-aminomethyl-7-deazaguanine transporter [Aggregatibacter actinomycetemcomitans]MBN6063012.1 7-cyano-7-deazaguanine/7-aminomethyl-7-deazaguanine transporter [Aggregatibacter actinomycetemcomitans]MBN6078154.1 7-cyano-7-deazaguanine/7-aminomethyl-7-deazaguanine transporter [Aggregatibacter actinomycetemcomitans]MBN6079759.1 7-cyano-7-deazaguanine/7-aminomethyl-7-deazaguanine transporter [Aggregatibacter actinomycetemcomitans]MBN6081058.1 7-cyano-7-deazaguanine/7-aminome